jgi:solute carrier family 25 phosphate transporter 3
MAAAIDHPVDHAFLGIPIPVPDPRYFVSGGLCAALSHGVTTPIDVVKTRIQSEPEVFNQGLVSATKAIVSEDGIGSLLGGLGPTVVGYGIEGAMKFGLYESLKPTFAQFLPSDSVALAYLGASVCAGAAASFLLCPMEHTRIRLVTEPSFAKGLVRTSRDEDPCIVYAQPRFSVATFR